MVGRRAVLGILAAGAAVVLAGCNGISHERFEPVRYRLTAEVETPEGVRIGSSVIEVTWGASRLDGPFGGAGYSVKGEAAAVDLPGGQTLFVLLSSADDVDWAAWVIKRIPTAGKAEQAIPESSDPKARIASARRELDLIRADRAIHPVWSSAPPHQIAGLSAPTLVRFRDVANPKSVEQVDPDNLVKSFGPGYRLKSLTVQMTDAFVTTGIEKRLGWLGKHAGSLVQYPSNKPISEIPEVHRLTEQAFEQGTVK